MPDEQLDLDGHAARLEPIMRPCGYCRPWGSRGWILVEQPAEHTETCPHCQGAGVVDTNPDTAPIPF